MIFMYSQLLIACCFKGVVIKYNEPIEARKPRTRWRLYPFKGEEAMCTYLKAQKFFVLASQDYRISLKLTPLVKAKMKPAPVMNTPYWSLNCFVFLVFTTVFQLILVGEKSPCTPFRTMLEVVFLGASLINHLATYSVYPGRDLLHLPVFYFDVRNIKKIFLQLLCTFTDKVLT